MECFAGAGGSLIGYHEEGFKTVMAVEIDGDAVETLKANNVSNQLVSIASLAMHISHSLVILHISLTSLYSMGVS